MSDVSYKLETENYLGYEQFNGRETLYIYDNTNKYENIPDCVLKIYYRVDGESVTLPNIPTKLRCIDCSNCNLTQFPEIPTTLRKIYVNDNNINFVNLPNKSRLNILNVSNNSIINNINCPKMLTQFKCENNKCLNKKMY